MNPTYKFSEKNFCKGKHCYYNQVINLTNNRISASYVVEDEKQKSKFLEKTWTKALSNYALTKYNSKSRKPIHYNKQRKMGREHLLQILETDLSNVQNLVDELIQGIEEELANPNFSQIGTYKTRKDKLPPAAPRDHDASGQRKRQRWNSEEDKILIQEHQIHVGEKRIWGIICQKVKNRTNIDCKDRWRNLMKKHQTEKTVYELLKNM
jgi:Myb-like DNA-binding domain